MKNLFYYIYYRLAHFYRRCGTPSPDLSAYSVLCVIQILTVAILFVACRKVCLQIFEGIDYDVIIFCSLCVMLYAIQWPKFRFVYDKLQAKWGNEPPMQRRIRKYMIILYIVFVLVVLFCIIR